MIDLTREENKTEKIKIKRSFYKKGCFFVVILIVGLITIGLYGGGMSKAQQWKERLVENANVSNNGENAEFEASDPQVRVTGIAMSNEYLENETVANKKYEGKTIEISGKVASVTKGMLGRGMIIKFSDGEHNFNSTLCYMRSSEKDNVMSLKQDQPITLIGRGDGAALGLPILRDCIFR